MRTRNLIQSRLPKAEALEVRMESYVGGGKSRYLNRNQSWILGWRQGQWLWHPVKALNNLQRSIKFLSRYNQRGGKILILSDSDKIALQTNAPENLKWVHNWIPGSYSRIRFHKAMGVMISPGSKKWNEIKKEGKSKKLPLIGFGSSQENLGGYDYPVPLSLYTKESLEWYTNLFSLFCYKKEKSLPSNNFDKPNRINLKRKVFYKPKSSKIR